MVQEVRRNERVQVVQHEPGIADVALLLDHDLLVAEIGDSETAQMLGGARDQEVVVARFDPHVAIDVTLVAPALHVRRDLALEERPKGIAEQVMLVVEAVSHHRSPVMAPSSSVQYGRWPGVVPHNPDVACARYRVGTCSTHDLDRCTALAFGDAK